MRFVTRTLVFAIVMLVSFWFTAENANETVNINVAFLRIRTSLPLVIFVSLLTGMAASTFVGWRAERRAARAAVQGATVQPAAVQSGRVQRAVPDGPLGPGEAGRDSADSFARGEPEPLERSPLS